MSNNMSNHMNKHMKNQLGIHTSNRPSIHMNMQNMPHPLHKKALSLIIAFSLMFTSFLPMIGHSSFAEMTENDMKGLWVATVLNIDYPSKASTNPDILKREADAVLDKAKEAGLNAVFLQVRPTADAIYPSKFFPWSRYLTGKQGLGPSDTFDPLAYWVEGAHKRGLQLHAWINPYRITKKTSKEKSHDFDSLSPDHPARLHPEWVVLHTDGNLYFDPGLPAVRQYIIDSISELCDNYAIDGIHFDDYFYPGTKFADSATFKSYGNGYVKIDDWRRNNVTLLVKGVSDSLKARDSKISFGISPFGIWANRSSNPLGSDTNGLQSYQDHYADTRGWVKSEIIDYIAPQLYWNIGFKVADYAKLLTWWSNVVNGTNVKLYIGHAAYRSGNTTPSSPWAGTSEIQRQLNLNSKTANVSGSIFYNYTALKKSPDLVKTIFRGMSGQQASATVPVVPSTPTQTSPPQTSQTQSSLSIAKYGTSVKVSASGLFLSGTSDPSVPLYVNGKAIENRSRNGYFGYYAKLATGRNSITFSQGNVKKTIVVTRSGSTTSSASSSNRKTAEVTSTFPSAQEMRLSGSTITLSCLAPVGSSVHVEINGERLPLKPALSQTRQSGIVLTRFSTTYRLPEPPTTSTPYDLGSPIYRMTYKGLSMSRSATASIYSLSTTTPLVAVVKEPVVDTYKGPTTANGSNGEIYQGMIDRVTTMTGEYIGLSSGLWVKKDKVDVITDTLQTPISMSDINTSVNGAWESIQFQMDRPLIGSNSFDGKELKVSFGTTSDQMPPMPVFTDNSIFQSMKYETSDGKSTFTLTPKNGQVISGYVLKPMGNGVSLDIKRKPLAMDLSKPLTGLTILLDPGHGGSDPGALGPKGADLAEKHINLSVALALERKLIDEGATIVMTRRTDVKLSLNERLAMSRDLKPDLFISVHADSIDDFRDINQIKGFTIYHNPTGLSGKVSDKVLQRVVTDLGRQNRGVKTMNFYVTKGSWSPAMLIETGFVPNPHEFDWLTDESSVNSLAEKITEGLRAYYAPSSTAKK